MSQTDSKNFLGNSKAVESLPKPVGYVNDFEDVFTNEEEDSLTKAILQIESISTDQIAIVTIDTIAPYIEMFEFSFDLAQKWGVGHQVKNNGILIAYSKQMREVRIQNGYGIEKRLTDFETSEIISRTMIPHLKKAEFYLAFKKGIEAIRIELFKKE